MTKLAYFLVITNILRTLQLMLFFLLLQILENLKFSPSLSCGEKIPNSVSSIPVKSWNPTKLISNGLWRRDSRAANKLSAALSAKLERLCDTKLLDYFQWGRCLSVVELRGAFMPSGINCCVIIFHIVLLIEKVIRRDTQILRYPIVNT